jgi:exodeoxyribonuclease VII small subunit
MLTGDQIPAEVASLSFEQALEALDQIVRQLEGGQIPLEKSIEIYARGTLLRRHCEAKLRDAQERIERISLDANGAPVAAAANIE